MLSESDVSFIRREVLVHPGITSQTVTSRLEATHLEVQAVLQETALVDTKGRWWPMMNVGRLTSGCMVRSRPDDLDPPDDHWAGWHTIDHVVVHSSTATITLSRTQRNAQRADRDTWLRLPARQLVIYRPHPLTVGGGPWS